MALYPKPPMLMLQRLLGPSAFCSALSLLACTGSGPERSADAGVSAPEVPYAFWLSDGKAYAGTANLELYDEPEASSYRSNLSLVAVERSSGSKADLVELPVEAYESLALKYSSLTSGATGYWGSDMSPAAVDFKSVTRERVKGDLRFLDANGNQVLSGTFDAPTSITCYPKPSSGHVAVADEDLSSDFCSSAVEAVLGSP